MISEFQPYTEMWWKDVPPTKFQPFKSTSADR